MKVWLVMVACFSGDLPLLADECAERRERPLFLNFPAESAENTGTLLAELFRPMRGQLGLVSTGELR